MIEAILEKISSGGVIMFPIIILSITLWVLIIERLLFLRDERRAPESLADKLLPRFLACEWEEIDSSLSRTKGAVARTFHRVAHKRPGKYEQLISALEVSAREELHSVLTRVNAAALRAEAARD